MRGTYFKYALLIEEDVYNAATPNFLLKYLLEKEKKRKLKATKTRTVSQLLESRRIFRLLNIMKPHYTLHSEADPQEIKHSCPKVGRNDICLF